MPFLNVVPPKGVYVGLPTMSLSTSIGLVAVPDTLIAVGDLITSVIVNVISAPPPPPKLASVIVTVSFVSKYRPSLLRLTVPEPFEEITTENSALNPLPLVVYSLESIV